jgi:hypothetical protein
MKQKALITIGIFILVFALIILNMISSINLNEKPDNENFPNRSSYNTGSTGTKAFFDLLAETGRKPLRWQEPIARLKLDPEVKTFVIIEPVIPFTQEEIAQLLEWVSKQKTLILISRKAGIRAIESILKNKYWAVKIKHHPILPTGSKSNLEEAQIAKPTIPSIYSNQVNSIQPSEFASTFEILNLESIDSLSDSESIDDEFDEERKPNTKEITQLIESLRNQTDQPQKRPIIHFANDKKNLMLEFYFGSGKIIYLSDSYIVSNAGIQLADNSRLATNLVNQTGGIIAFDEYHHGYGSANKALLDYLFQTPIGYVLIQLAVMAFAILFTQSRRFGRPLPVLNPSRLSKLEYISAMAELQRTTKAYDLALENFYSNFRRRVARNLGVDSKQIKSYELACRIAERTGLKVSQVEPIILRCDDIIYGAPTKKKEVMRLISELRKIEQELGISRNPKQTL